MGYATEKSIYEELKPFASMVIDQGRGVTVSDLAFASAEDRYSTAFISLPLANVYPGSTTVKLFQKNIGEAGQGSGTLALTRGETNNTNGDRQPSNQVYIGTHLGFQVYAITTATTPSLNNIKIQNPNTLFKICNNTVWNLTVGDGIKRTLGKLIDYPSGGGIDGMIFSSTSCSAGALPTMTANNGWVGCAKRKLPIPVVFPPNVQVDIELETGAAQTLIDNVVDASVSAGSFSTGSIAIVACFKGFRMTLPA
jgi:hypothetical protein